MAPKDTRHHTLGVDFANTLGCLLCQDRCLGYRSRAISTLEGKREHTHSCGCTGEAQGRAEESKLTFTGMHVGAQDLVQQLLQVDPAKRM